MQQNKRGLDLDWLSQFLLIPLLFLQICDGYFVHYFAPRSFLPVKKNVVFVIDASGSMFGTKRKQVTRTLGIVHCS